MFPNYLLQRGRMQPEFVDTSPGPLDIFTHISLTKNCKVTNSKVASEKIQIQHAIKIERFIQIEKNNFHQNTICEDYIRRAENRFWGTFWGTLN